MNAEASDDRRNATVTTTTWAVVPHACTASFAVRDKLVTTVRGTFPVRGGCVVTDATGGVVRAHLELDVAGVQTGNAHRDRDLHKPRFLDAAGHPAITVDVGPSAPRDTGWTVPAALSARGASVPLELQITPTSVDGHRARIRVTARLDRTGLGMRVPTLIIGRHVEIVVDALFERN